jgi:hypothetical protein
MVFSVHCNLLYCCAALPAGTETSTRKTGLAESLFSTGTKGARAVAVTGCGAGNFSEPVKLLNETKRRSRQNSLFNLRKKFVLFSFLMK